MTILYQGQEVREPGRIEKPVDLILQRDDRKTAYHVTVLSIEFKPGKTSLTDELYIDFKDAGGSFRSQLVAAQINDSKLPGELTIVWKE